jgi:hypothetical protein
MTLWLKLAYPKRQLDPAPLTNGKLYLTTLSVILSLLFPDNIRGSELHDSSSEFARMPTEIVTFTSTRNTSLNGVASAIPTYGTLRYITNGDTPTVSPYPYHLPPLTEFSDVRSIPIADIKTSLELDDETPYTLTRMASQQDNTRLDCI